MFNPDRFFDESGQLQEDPTPAYGFGRKVCAGKHVASASLWLAMSSMLACFDFKKARDKDGKEIEINNDYEDFATISYKAPYRCTISPRSEDVRSMIKEALSTDSL